MLLGVNNLFSNIFNLILMMLLDKLFVLYYYVSILLQKL